MQQRDMSRVIVEDTLQGTERQPVASILIVEDNDAQRKILQDLMQDEGFEPVACSNATTAIEQVRQRAFAVAIVDQRLPEMSGTELIEQVRETREGIRTIIHTGYGSFESAKEAVNLGVFAYVEKLGPPAELIRHVHRAVQDWMAEALQRSEEKYRQLVDSVQAIVWRSDPATAQFTFVSREAETMLGYPVDRWLHEPTFWQGHIHPDDRDWVVERCMQATVDQQSQEFEYRMVDTAGRIVWLRDFVNIILEDGRPRELVGVMIDITERKQFEEALRESEERLKEAQRLAHIGSWELDLITGRLVWSDEMYRIHGIPPGSFEGDVEAFITTTVHPEDHLRVEQTVQCALDDCAAFKLDYRILRPDGTRRCVSAQGKVLCDGRGEAVRMVGVVQDITERKQAEVALRRSEKSFRLMFAHNPLPMWVYDRETFAFLDVNDAALEHYGYTREEFLSMSISDLWPVDDIPRFHRYIETMTEAVQMVSEWKHRKKDGAVIDVEITAHAFPYRERPGQLVLANDVTERKRLEKEILEISSREQRRIGQDLHDELGQLLTGIGFRIEELKGDLGEEGLTLAADTAEIGQLVEKAIAQTRALARGLNPVDVEQQDLATALRELTLLAKGIYGVSCIFECEALVHVDNQDVATHVYRIVQESMNNAIKHAQASRIHVALRQTGEVITLTISDNGVGISPASHRREGMGLRIMDYRTRMIGGTFEVRPRSAGGTEVLCRFPATSVQQSVV